MTNNINLRRENFRSKLLPVILIASISIQIGCASPGSVDTVPVSESATHVLLPGKFVWHDLLTSDVGAAKSFYGPMFGWSFVDRERYTVVRHGGVPIAGLVEIPVAPGESRAARWIASVSVPDVEKASDFVVAEGGKLHEGPGEMPRRGRVSFVSDPHGAQLMLIRARDGDPEDRPAETGGWLWDELWTDDAADSVNFYSELAGYSSEAASDEYTVLVANDRWRAGVRTLFEKDLEQRWVPVIKVEDVGVASAMAEELGGTVIVAGDSADAEATAVLADPGGALLMVQEWQGSGEGEGDSP